MMRPHLSSTSTLGRLVRYPLKLMPATAVVPILSGPLRGKRWLVGSSLHGCWIGSFEREKQELMAREVRPDTVFYDIGANVGFYSLLASMLVSHGRVFAFEPLPENMGYLRRHLDLNGVRNVECLDVAVCDRVGEAYFRADVERSMGHLESEGKIRVATTTLDHLLQADQIPPPNYIKMDIEGAEVLALRGATTTFNKYRPTLVLATHSEGLHAECLGMLRSWGYHWQLLGPIVNGHGEIIAHPQVQPDCVKED